MREFFKLISFCGGLVAGIGTANYYPVLLSPENSLWWIGIGIAVFLFLLAIERMVKLNH